MPPAPRREQGASQGKEAAAEKQTAHGDATRPAPGSASDTATRSRLAIGVRQRSTLPRRLRNEWCRHVLDRFAAALGARRMGRCVFSEMFRVVENLTALLATILIGGHDAPPTCMVQGLAAAGLPATSGNLGFHSRTPCRARHGLSFRMTGTASGTPASHRAPCVLIMETCACLLAA